MDIERRRWNPDERELAGLGRALGIHPSRLLQEIGPDDVDELVEEPETVAK